jgi:hypothetical protein
MYSKMVDHDVVVMRHLHFMRQFDMELVHIKGKDNPSDGLSRQFADNDEEDKDSDDDEDLFEEVVQKFVGGSNFDEDNPDGKGKNDGNFSIYTGDFHEIAMLLGFNIYRPGVTKEEKKRIKNMSKKFAVQHGRLWKLPC